MKKVKAYLWSILLPGVAMVLLLSIGLSGSSYVISVPVSVPHTSTVGTIAAPTTVTPTTILATTLPATLVPTTAVTTTAQPTAAAPTTTIIPTTVPVITVPPTTAFVPQPTVPATTVAGEYIGLLYTRQYLQTLDRTSCGYGPGYNVDSKNRPTAAAALTQRFQKFDARFIGEDNGCIYLSFNCGYEYNNLTTVILDKLKNKNVKVVFFVNRHFVRSNPQLIQRIIDEGHILGNHCTNHPELPTLSIDGIVEEIMTVHNYVLEEFGYEMKLFRPPSGTYSEQVFAIAQSLGYRSYNFSCTYADWYTAPEKQPNPESTLTMLTNKAHSGAIYQLHSVSTTNATIIDRLIDNLRAQGYTFALLP